MQYNGQPLCPLRHTTGNLNIANLRTKCPFEDCHSVFEVSCADPSRPVPGTCPTCNRAASFKPLYVIEKLEKAKTLSAGNGSLPVSALSVIVEDVRSLWNVGSIFRTADGAGFGTIYLSGITGRPPRKEIAKTSLGAEDHIAWQYFVSAVEIIPQLKAHGTRIVGLEKNEQSVDLSTVLESGEISTPLCLIVGNEVTGLSLESLSYCDKICHLPMRGMKQSLNVAVAFGVASYLLSARFNRE